MSGASTTNPVASQPHDSCVRCGRPTPLGVALCEHDNPGHIRGPSATQVHGTIVVGIIAGFILFALLGRLATGGGPFEASIVGSARQPDGRTAVLVNVVNAGAGQAAASCRISQGGLVGSGDDVFFSQPIPAGGSLSVERMLPAVDIPAAGGRPPVIAIRCN